MSLAVKTRKVTPTLWRGCARTRTTRSTSRGICCDSGTPRGWWHCVTLVGKRARRAVSIP